MATNKRLLIIDSSGRITGDTTVDPANYVPSNYGSNISYPILVDTTTANVALTTTTTFGGRILDVLSEMTTVRDPILNPPIPVTVSTSKLVNPLVEQKITGSGYGSFAPNELVFQSNIRPEIINFYAPSGIVASEYNPTVGIIGVSGYLGLGAAQFKGSYLDTNTAAAGISLPGFASSTYFLVSGWLYMDSLPSIAYDPILITRSPSGVYGSTSDSFRLEYDNSASRFQFHFSTSSNTSTAGYDYIMNVSPSGISLNTWNHFAVAYTNAGGSASVSSYWNGNRIQKYSTTGSIRNSTSSVYVGCDGYGNLPFKGWIDDLLVSSGNTVDVIRGFSQGLTAPVPSAHQDVGPYTVYYLSMDGPIGTSYFPCDTTNRIVSVVAAVEGTSNLYVYGTQGSTYSYNWSTPLVGYCGGFAAPSSVTAGYLFGYDTGACLVPTSVADLTGGLAAAKTIKTALIDNTFRFVLGLSMSGTSASPGSLTNLYARGWTLPFSYAPTEYNLNVLKTSYDSIVSGSSASVGVTDYSGNYYVMATGPVSGLYLDVLNYFNTVNADRSGINSVLAAKSSFTTLNQDKGFTRASVTSKLAGTNYNAAAVSKDYLITQKIAPVEKDPILSLPEGP